MTDDLMERLSAYRDVLDEAIRDDLDGDRRGAKARPARRRWMLAVVAAGLVAAGVGALVVNAARTDPSSDQVPGPSATAGPISDVPPASTSVTTAAPSTILEGAAVRGWTRLRDGSQHPDVRRLEERLVSLGYVINGVDGDFDDQTRLAVVAYERLQAGISPADATGVVTAELWDQLLEAVPARPRRSIPDGSHVEIYLPERVLAVFDGDVPVAISAASAGDGEEWCDEVTIDPGEIGNQDGTEPVTLDQCGRAITPGGRYGVFRRVEGMVDTSIGTLKDPVFYNYTLAIYGIDVPDIDLAPPTRGGVAVPDYVAARLGDEVDLGDEVFVWDGENEPEHYGEQLPMFNWPEAAVVIDRLAIGDSVMLGAAPELVDEGFTVDARETVTSHDIGSMAEPLRDGGRLGDLVVVHVGTNGPIGEADMAAMVDALAEVPHVLLLTVDVPRDYTAGNNRLIHDTAAASPNVSILDWAELAGACPGDCFYDDGIHLRPDGQRYYADLISTAVGQDEL